MSARHAAVIARLIDAINERDGARRGALVAEVFTEDCRYTDPDDDARGRDAVAALFGRLAEGRPTDLAFSLAGPVDAHHEQARFTWHFGPPGGRAVASGTDVAVFAGGRVRRLYAFFDR
ncbi:nuclear transport factor 2 family protein [Streptomyces avicenniae]|uniref:nuclear transport factor 2 family protein n=1 Tax=Streptomyces avicenniae TaxID=500153 RepID=UPI000AD17962|nr:nuclear transport factor 2 family protein [Streptomyces avicenniae]